MSSSTTTNHSNTLLTKPPQTASETTVISTLTPPVSPVVPPIAQTSELVPTPVTPPVPAVTTEPTTVEPVQQTSQAEQLNDSVMELPSTPAIKIINADNLPNETMPADSLNTIADKIKTNVNSSTQGVLANQEVVYVVQVAALIDKKDVNHKIFNGLDGLSVEKSGDFYRYLYRSTKSYDQAETAQRYVISKGFTKAFIVAYVDGVRISGFPSGPVQ